MKGARMIRRIQKIMNIVIAMSILHSATMPLYAQPTLRERAYQTGQSLWSGAQRAGSYVGAAPWAVSSALSSGGEWTIQKIQEASTQFPVWGRRRIANGLQLFATPSEREQTVIDRWVKGSDLSSEQAQVWQRFYRRALSSRSAIGTMIGIITAILGGIAAYQRLISDRQGQPQAPAPAPTMPAQQEISEEQVTVGRRRASGRPRPISPVSKPSTFHAARSVKPAPRQVTEEQVTVGRRRASGRQRPISPVSKPPTFHATRPAQQAQRALPAPLVPSEEVSIPRPEGLAAARLEGGEAPAYVPPAPPERPIRRPRSAPGRRFPSRRRRSGSAAPAMQAQEQQASTEGSQLSGSWVVVPTEWERIKENIQNYMAEVREQIKHGNVVPYDETELQKLVKKAPELPDVVKQAIQRDLNILLGKRMAPGEVQQLIKYIMDQGQGPYNYDEVVDSIEANLARLSEQFAPQEVYSFLGLTNEQGHEMSGQQVMQHVEARVQKLEEDTANWVKRQLGWIFEHEKNKKLYDAYLQGREAVESLSGSGVSMDTVLRQLDEIQDPETGLLMLLRDLQIKLQRQ